ncbi:oocyte zinc finger protein XlCOF19-like [Onthophagus taurus]|uniref:oocyte zinc finger protein XlCOF19-like n=1 Tax=Onthophagus taurus TaxID=166361 RepID=UPI0039BDFBE5
MLTSNCRICLKLNENFRSIFDENIELKMCKCFSIKIKKDDLSPNRICESCYIKLNDFYEFQQLYYESQKEFESKLNGVIVNNDNNKVFVESEVTFNATYDLNQNSQTVLRHSSDFYNKIEKISGNKEIALKKKFPCQHCKKVFTRRNNLNVHLTLHAKTKPFTCEICFKTFANERHLKTHKITHTNKYRCEMCQKSFTVPSKYQRHLRIHFKEKVFICPVENCGKSFTDKSNLKGHEFTHLNVKLFGCTVCNKSYRTRTQLNDHMKSHDNPKFSCKDCGKKYKWKSNLLVHLRKKVQKGCCNEKKIN